MQTDIRETTAPAEPSATDQVREKAQETAGQVQEKAHQAAGQAKNRVAEQVDQRSTQAGEHLGSTASDVRSVAEELRRQGKDKPARLAQQTADRVERVGGYLRDSDSDRILRDLEDFGRRKPWAVAAGGLALGFAASRFLKASSNRRYHATSNGDRAYRPSATSAPRAQLDPAHPGVA
jgi:hypothetical protein